MRARLGAVALAGALFVAGQTADRIEVVPLPGGGVLLNTGWIVWPAGRQVEVGGFPLNAALSPDGRFLAVLDCGAPSSIVCLRLPEAAEVSRLQLPEAWQGLAFSPDGRFIYASGGSEAAVYEISFNAGQIKLARTFPLVEPAKRSSLDFAGDLTFSPDGRLIYVAELFRNTVAVVNPQSGWVIDRFPVVRRPYRILAAPDGRSFLVTSWSDGVLARYSAERGAPIERVRLGPQPGEMIWLPPPAEPEQEEDTRSYKARLLVTVQNTNNVHVLGLTEAGNLEELGVVNLAWTSRQPAGMTPSGLAFDPASQKAFVTCADANAVAVLNARFKMPVVEGFVPVGWYPAAVRALSGGGLAVVNARGSGPVSGSGTVSIVPQAELEKLDDHTLAVLENSPYDDAAVEEGQEEGMPGVYPASGKPGPVRYVVYAVMGAPGYDEVFGQLEVGKGKAALARYGAERLPNFHRLARQFVLFDNFYRIGDTWIEGLHWALAGIAPAYVLRLSPPGVKRAVPGLEGGERAAYPPAGYLWQNALQAGFSVRNYGCLAGEAGVKAFTYSLASTEVGGRDMALARAFASDLAKLDKQSGEMARLTTLCLEGRDPEEADRALGLIAETLSHSRYWPEAVLLVAAGGGRGGNDHVSPYRAPAFLVSPYARRRVTDSNFYNTLTWLRTAEKLLGLRPMTIFDAAAQPLRVCFQDKPDLTPYRSPTGSRPW